MSKLIRATALALVLCVSSTAAFADDVTGKSRRTASNQSQGAPGARSFVPIPQDRALVKVPAVEPLAVSRAKALCLALFLARRQAARLRAPNWNWRRASDAAMTQLRTRIEAQTLEDRQFADDQWTESNLHVVPKTSQMAFLRALYHKIDEQQNDEAKENRYLRLASFVQAAEEFQRLITETGWKTPFNFAKRYAEEVERMTNMVSDTRVSAVYSRLEGPRSHTEAERMRDRAFDHANDDQWPQAYRWLFECVLCEAVANIPELRPPPSS